ncbi:hypothetical protein PUV54_05215 [Hyphococcus flavus]|uniref:Uncharacterized protein n=1 Tax=Hyphococcus flavus TaxID=1866326 RepID=A0AAF0CGS9_9PROT|nr:hypothetical protein [Hyphococcus flavus]WDI32593.1 hypothetical protein PUV54_05215 [Hyphococcus flavus]
MSILKTAIAFLVSLIATYVLATGFYTQQVIAKQAAIGAVYSPQQQLDTFILNFTGLTIYGAIIAIMLAVAFLVAFGVKRVLKPLSPIAYPAAGAVGMLAMLTLVEQQLGGGAGIIGGARDAFGVSLQCLAGLIGGIIFANLRPR